MKLVMALAALLVVALVGLALMLTSPSSAPTPSVAPAAAPQPQPPKPSISVTTEPAPTADAPREPSATPRVENVYSVGGVVVHDYTGGEPMTRQPDFTPPEGVTLPAKLANEVTNVVAPAARQCLQTIPESSRSDETKLHVTMTVAVKNGSLTVADVAAKVNGLDERALAPTLSCLHDRMIGTSVDAAGQPDVPSYLISTYYLAK